MARLHCVTLLGLVAAGCGAVACSVGTPHTAGTHPQPTDPAKTLIVLENHVTWPSRVERAAVVIDGRLESLTTRAPAPGEAQRVAEVALPPGRHTLALLVDAAYPGAMLGGGCATRVRKVVPIVVGASPATLVVDLYSRDRTAPFHDRIDVAVTTRGAASAPPRPAPLTTTARSPECERSDAVAEGALCSIDAKISSAGDAGDSAWASCLEDKRAKLRALVPMRDRRQALADSAAEPLLRDHHQAVLGIVQARIAEVAGEIDGCASAAVELARALDREVPTGACPDFWPNDADETNRGAALEHD